MRERGGRRGREEKGGKRIKEVEGNRKERLRGVRESEVEGKSGKTRGEERWRQQWIGGEGEARED